MKFSLKNVLLATILLTTFIVVLSANKASAVSGSDWRAGRIIDDAVFFNKDSMTPGQIQDFLNAKVPVCQRWHSGFTGTSGTRYDPPFTCLKEYIENPTSHENNIGRLDGAGNPYQVPGGKTAAQIIWDAGQAYAINPQVILTMLQKESYGPLITDDWPASYQYKTPMGYACPDTAPCDSQYFGFYNQVNNAAWQLRRYVTYPDQYNFKSGVTRNILWQVGGVCGSSPVYIETQGTAALYNYTPYQPNQSALNNLYGTGDSCSAYGNRNFWRIFNDWFGSTLTDCFTYSPTQYGIYRLSNRNNGGSLLTTNGCEAKSAVKSGYYLDGQTFLSSPSDEVRRNIPLLTKR
jgi:hypothetical protein